VKSKLKSIKRNLPLSNDNAVTKRLNEIERPSVIIPHSEIPGIGTHKVGPKSGSDTPIIAGKKQSRPMMEVTETIRASVLLSSDQPRT